MRLGVVGRHPSRFAWNSINDAKEEEKAEMIVAKVIEFYIPGNFRKSVTWVPPQQRGKIIQFPSQVKKSA